MKIVPWILVLALAAGAAWFYSENQQRSVELAAAKAKMQELKAAAAELDELKSQGPQITADEIERLRKDNQEVYKLRAEVNQVRKEYALLKQQNAELNQQQQQQQQQQAYAEQPAVEQPVPEQEDAETIARRERAMQCIGHLKIVEDAKTKWAEANSKTGGDTVNVNDITAFLPNSQMPGCPDNGSYNLNEVGIPASCTVEGHSLLP